MGSRTGQEWPKKSNLETTLDLGVLSQATLTIRSRATLTNRFRATLANLYQVVHADLSWAILEEYSRVMLAQEEKGLQNVFSFFLIENIDFFVNSIFL